MDAAPFRQFLSLNVYASKEDLSEAVGRDKGADAVYVQEMDCVYSVSWDAWMPRIRDCMPVVV